MSFTGLLKAMATSFGAASLGDSLLNKSGASLFRPLANRVLIVVATTVALFVAIPFAVDIVFPKDFAGAVTPSRLLVLAAAFAAIRRSVVEMAKGLGLARIGSATEVLQVLFFVVIALLLGRDAEGIAMATSIALGISCVLTAVWVWIESRAT